MALVITVHNLQLHRKKEFRMENSALAHVCYKKEKEEGRKLFPVFIFYA